MSHTPPYMKKALKKDTLKLVLQLYSLPRNEARRRKWLNVIGPDNINSQHKRTFICSLHFEESQFNKTLDMVRLRDDAVPTLFDVPSEDGIHRVQSPRENLDPLQIMTSPSARDFLKEEPDPLEALEEEPSKQNQPSADQPSSPANSDYTQMTSPIANRIYFRLSSSASDRGSFLQKGPLKNTQRYLYARNRGYFQVCSRTFNRGSNIHRGELPLVCGAAEQGSLEFNKVLRLKTLCEERRKKIKRLHEKVRRQGKKIVYLEKLIKEHKQKKTAGKLQWVSILKHDEAKSKG